MEPAPRHPRRALSFPLLALAAGSGSGRSVIKPVGRAGTLPETDIVEAIRLFRPTAWVDSVTLPEVQPEAVVDAHHHMPGLGMFGAKHWSLDQRADAVSV